MKTKKLLLALPLFSLCFLNPPAYAGITNGLTETVLAPLEIPKGIFQGGLNPISMVGGAISGTAHAVTNVIGGLGQIVQGTATTGAQAAQAAAPYAKYAPLLFL